MEIKTLKTLPLEYKEQLLKLWNTEYPKHLAFNNLAGFDTYLEPLENKNHFLLVDEQNIINGWLFTFLKEGEVWFGMIVKTEIQGQGYGSELLQLVKQNTTCLNGWVIDHSNDLKENGEAYVSPIPFYLKNDFIILKDLRLNYKKLIAVKIKWAIHK